ncbi:MAG: hypothetical protein AAF826_07970, partial [Pseudomonadota bacterium]
FRRFRWSSLWKPSSWSRSRLKGRLGKVTNSTPERPRKELGRKFVAFGLFVSIFLGFQVGLTSIDFFYGLAGIPEYPHDETVTLSFPQFIMVTLALYGMFIWPAVLAVGFQLCVAIYNHRVIANQWEYETFLREKRRKDVEMRIEEARSAGTFENYE